MEALAIAVASAVRDLSWSLITVDYTTVCIVPCSRGRNAGYTHLDAIVCALPLFAVNVVSICTRTDVSVKGGMVFINLTHCFSAHGRSTLCACCLSPDGNATEAGQRLPSHVSLWFIDLRPLLEFCANRVVWVHAWK